MCVLLVGAGAHDKISPDDGRTVKNTVKNVPKHYRFHHKDDLTCVLYINNIMSIKGGMGGIHWQMINRDVYN